MNDEYSMRAQLLLKRLDVTVQSFTWSDRVRQMEAELYNVYRPLRQSMRAESTVSVADVLAARADLCRVDKTVTGSARAQTRINRVMMSGELPDRGGRTTEMERPPPEMPAWQKQRASTGAQPQRHSSTGGGRGRGGGGRHQPHQQQSLYMEHAPSYGYEQAPLSYGNPAYSVSFSTPR